MRVMIVDDDDGIRDFLIVMLENMLPDFDVVECVSGNQAIKVLSSDPYFQLIISDYDMEDGNAITLHSYLHESGIQTPYLLYTARDLSETEFQNFPRKEEEEYYVKKGIEINALREELKKINVISTELSKKILDSEYKKVRIFYFYRFSKTLADVYVKLSDRKYVKIINAGDKFDQTIIERYANRRQNYLYIKSEDYSGFAGSMAKLPFLVFDENTSPEERITRTTAIIQNMAMQTGLTKSVVKLAEKNIDEVIKEAGETKSLAQILAQMRAKNDYTYDHSYLLSYFCCVLCDKLGWSTRRSREKLCFAALFHDAVLRDPNTAMVRGKDTDAFSALSEPEQKNFLEHPEKGSKLVSELAREYPNVDDIILHHHERIDGSGFPRGIDYSKLPTLSSLFILAHDFVSRMYEVDFDTRRYYKILIEMKETYNKGHFLKIFDAFEEVLDSSFLDDLEL